MGIRTKFNPMGGKLGEKFDGEYYLLWGNNTFRFTDLVDYPIKNIKAFPCKVYNVDSMLRTHIIINNKLYFLYGSGSMCRDLPVKLEEVGVYENNSATFF